MPEPTPTRPERDSSVSDVAPPGDSPVADEHATLSSRKLKGSVANLDENVVSQAISLSHTRPVTTASSDAMGQPVVPHESLINQTRTGLSADGHATDSAQPPLRAVPASTVEHSADAVTSQHPILGAMEKLFGSVLAPVFAPGPTTSSDSPFGWLALAWARRQIGYSESDSVTKLTSLQTPLLTSTMTESVITLGAAAAEDPQNAGPAAVQSGLPSDLERTSLVTGLNQPTDFRFLPDGSILISEKGGAIKLYSDGSLHGEPLINLLVLPTDTDEERGLLGIEIDPHFAETMDESDYGYIYASYTTAQNFDRLSRLTITRASSDPTSELIVDPASELVLIESNQPGEIFHHGGEVQFGPDGKLYWAMGMNTINANSQDLTNVHGKILRLNPDGSVPADNPFLDTPGAVPEIWAYGLRNPFRFTFTPDGTLLAGDVGGSYWEEINVVTAGANYGWPLAEGACQDCSYVNPLYSYAHTPPPNQSGSITGIMVYTDDALGAEYQNKVFIADFALGWIKELTFDSEFTSFISERMFDDQAGTTVKLAQGPDGYIYQLTVYPGELAVIAPSGGNRAPTAVITATPQSGLSPLTVGFSASNSSDPDPGTTLTYLWDFGDGTTSTAASPSKTYVVQHGSSESYLVTLTVSDGAKTGLATQRITVGSTAPTANILTPIQNSLYSAGDVISFSANAFDTEDGALPDSAYEWTINFHHADHVHPFRSDITGPTGSVQIPRGADNIDTTWYRINLTVTDSSGLSTTRSVDVRPNLVTLTFNGNNDEAVYTIDGIPMKGPHSEQAVVGVERVLGAPSPQYVGDRELVFNSWSDNGAQTHTITTPSTNTSYTVTYVEAQSPPAPWLAGDVGAPTLAGSATYSGGTYTINGAGTDIWGTDDQFHFVHQTLSGDGEIIARVTAQETTTDGWAKAGVIIKQSTTAGSPYALLAVTPQHGVSFQHSFTQGVPGPAVTAPTWLKLARTGDVITAYSSTDGQGWTQVGTTTIDMPDDALIGLFVTSHKSSELNTASFDNVSVTETVITPPTTLPAPWLAGDVGAPTLAGSATYSGGTYTINGAGTDIWGTADQFHFVHQTLSGDGEIIARVTAQETTTDGWAKAGVIIKQSTTAGSPYALLAVTPQHGVSFQHSFTQGVPGPAVTAPTWLKLARTGDVITAYSSTDGQGWTQVGTTTIDMPDDALIGLFVTSHKSSELNTASFDNVSVTETVITPPTTLPAPWLAGDVGAPTLAGSATYSGGTYTINGAGTDIWGTADQFHFVHQTLSGDGEIIARVTAQETTTDGWAKAGVIIKQSTTAGSPYALLAVTPQHGVSFQHSFTQGVPGPAVTAPTWLKLARTGDVITAYSSTDGQGWTQVGTTTIDMPDDALIGLFVTSHKSSELNTASFDNVSVTETVITPPTTLPAPWLAGDVGAPTLAGSATYSGGTYTINGAGTDIWGTADQFHFVHQTLSGDGEIIARVTAQETTTDGWAKAGVIIKQSTTAGSPYALLAVTPQHGVSFQHSFTQGVPGPAVTAPTWLKLARTGDVITAYSSTDGQGWTQVGTTTIDMPDDALIGLFVTSHKSSELNTASFDNVSMTSAVL